jgi:hypothetical protein
VSIRPSNVGKNFKFGINGHGTVERESKADFDLWSPSIQILLFTDGHRELRFTYCDDSGEKSRPLYLKKEQLAELGKEVASGDPEILEWMRLFFEGCFGKKP